MASGGMIATVLKKRGKQLQTDWLQDLTAGSSAAVKSRISADELERQGSQFLQLLASVADGANDLNSAQSKPLRAEAGNNAGALRRSQRHDAGRERVRRQLAHRD